MRNRLLCTLAGMTLALAGPVMASSHREAPYITSQPKVDGADFYMFQSYETGRAGYTTLIATYSPLQTPAGAPNYYTLDPDALYEIHIDNNGDAVEDITFQFRFTNAITGAAVPVNGTSIAVPLMNIDSVGRGGARDDVAGLTVRESYTVNLIRGPRRANLVNLPMTDTATGTATFKKPVDNIGQRSLPDYDAYARNHIYGIRMPDCPDTGRVFVGQRRDPFAVNLGQVFDLVNTSTVATGNSFLPVGTTNEAAGQNVNARSSITEIALELPTACLTAFGGEPIIGAWTTASLPETRRLTTTPAPERYSATVNAGPYVQVSRLGMPLVNELVIGLPDKNRFNASEPKDDAQFAPYVLNPSLPALLEILFGPRGTVAALGITAPTLAPRVDLVETFITGNALPGVFSNHPANVRPAEMLRLNTSVAPKARAAQNRMGVIGGDIAGFPNGRRPGDDVVDITLRVAMGRLITLGLYGQPGQAPAGALDFTDGALQTATDVDAAFPYLRTPLPGNLVNPGTPTN